MANGGCTIVLSDDFIMDSYSSDISLINKTITIWGQGKVLGDTAGRIFSAEGAGSFLELHDVVFQNAQSHRVSG
jgi:hypothetical protein